MRIETEIRARLEELRKKLEVQEQGNKQHARRTGASRSNLGKPLIHSLEGQITALEWVLKFDGV